MNINSKSIDRMNKAASEADKYEPGKFEMGSIAPSLAGRPAFSVKAEKSMKVSAEQRIDQICALFKNRSKKLQALSKKPLPVVMSSISDLLLASAGIEDEVDEPETVKAFVYAMMQGLVASDGFEHAIDNSSKVYYVPAKDRDSIYLKSAYGQTFYGGYRAIVSVSIAELAKVAELSEDEFKSRMEALVEDVPGKDVMGDLLNTELTAFDLATMFHTDGISIDSMSKTLANTVNSEKIDKVASLMKAMDSCE